MNTDGIGKPRSRNYAESCGGNFFAWGVRDLGGSGGVDLLIYSCVFSTRDEIQNPSRVCRCQLRILTLALMFI